ncbi:MAG: 3-hydroxyisobutyrate dehydrogenase, partial [Pseudomonadota bacterium]
MTSGSQTMPSKVAFIGLGNMGGPMAVNLVEAGYPVYGFDLSADARATFATAGGVAVEDVVHCVQGADLVVTMLPKGEHVLGVYDQILDHVTAGALMIDCSTIDVDSARKASENAISSGRRAVDAPVSGGTAAAEAGTLTFMVGGAIDSFEASEPALGIMGKAVIHAGNAGAGQAAKICNNMLLGISMIGTCEAFLLAEKLGLEAEKLFDISSKASGQCWSLTSYCPVPGPLPTSPANRDYQPGPGSARAIGL